MTKLCSISCILIFVLSVHLVLAQQIPVIPLPKEVNLLQDKICLDNVVFYSEDPELEDLFEALKQELKILTDKDLQKTDNKNISSLIVKLDESLADEEYKIEFEESIQINGGSYKAVAMASVSLLQLLEMENNTLCWQKGIIKDYPEFPFRGLLIDLVRQKHDIETIKNVIRLCRWYKVNYLHLHLTDEKYFTFPSKAYPQLSSEGWTYTEEELKDLVKFAEDRGVELIPELEIPGHAGQLVEKMPEVFGFNNTGVNPYTIHMGREKAYEVIDTLVSEIAAVFHTSEYIHIGGDEANFSGMEKDPEIKQFLKKNELQDMEELFWFFINRVNSSVKKTGKKTIVWEGFSAEGNNIIDKDITVMAWETKYQLPQEILNSGYKTINVSWKPLYVVNEKKWSPKAIYDWNIYRWENWVPSIPSYDPIQINPHPGIIGAEMASWDQPAHAEIPSLRKRLPAMVEETWNQSNKPPWNDFENRLDIVNKRFDRYLTPVKLQVVGLSYPDREDGHKYEETWFDDEITIQLLNDRGLEVRYTTGNSEVTNSSTLYKEPVKIKNTTNLRYRAFQEGEPVGAEMLQYYEMFPIKVDLEGEFTVPLEDLWETPHAYLIKFRNTAEITISAAREGEIKYSFGDDPLNSKSKTYSSPIILNETTKVQAGLFVDGEPVGKIWIQHFEKQEN